MSKKLINVISVTFIVVILICALLIICPQIAGYTPYTVLSGSMEPSYPVGSIVFIGKVAPETVKVNDVIMFSFTDGTKVTHRVINVMPQEQVFVTKGDANNTEDFSPVPFNRLIGKVIFSLPLLGFPLALLKTGRGIAVFCMLLLLLVLLEFLPWRIKKLGKQVSP